MVRNKQFKWQDDLIHNIGLCTYKKDWVVKEIAYHPLKFAKRRMEDPTDDRPIMIRYFAKFALKTSRTKERINKYKEIYRSYDKYKDIISSYGHDCSTEELYKLSVRDIGIRNIKLVDEIYNKGSVISQE